MKKPSPKNREKEAEKPQNQQGNSTKSRCWLKIVVGISIFFLASTGVSLTYGWFLIQRKLLPLIEKEVGNYLHRPIDIGDLEGLSLTGARFGQSEITATADNPNTVSVKAVKVDWKSLTSLLKQRLVIEIILVKPDIYIEQDEKGVWTPTNFGTEPSSEEGFKVDVQTITLKQADITLVARNKETKQLQPQVQGKITRGIIRILADRDLIKFDVQGQLNQGGKIAVNGEGNTETDIINLTITGEELAGTEIGNLLALPLGIETGTVDGKIGVKFNDDPLPYLTGTAKLNRATVQIPELVKPFVNSNGELHFQGSEVTFDLVKTHFGEVAGLINGSLDFDEPGKYQIKAKTAPVEVEKVIEALELESPPIPLKGKIAGNIAINGSLLNPVTSFEIATTTPSQIDKVDFSKITAKLDLIGNNLYVRNFQGNPNIGGVITGSGTIELAGEQNLIFDVTASKIPGTKLARSYNNDLPVKLGNISGTARFIAQAGNLDSLKVINGQGNLALGNGTVKIEQLNYGSGNWRSRLTADGVEFGSLPIGEDSTPTIAKGLVDGLFEVSGKNNAVEIDKIQAQGRANLATVGGKIVIPEIELNNGNWQAALNTQDLRLKKLFPEVPPEFQDNLSGNFLLTGKVESKPNAETVIDGLGDLTLAQGTVKVDDFQIRGNNWQATALASNLQMQALNSEISDQFAGLVSGEFQIGGKVDNITPEAIEAKGHASLTLPEGVFAANDLAIANGKFQTLVIPQGVDLSLFADPNSDDLELNGKLGGELEVTGKIDNLNPSAVAAKGNLSFSQGIDLIEQPFIAALTWDGERLDVLQAQGDGLEATGYIKLDKSFFTDIPDKLAAVTDFNFDVVEAQWIDVNKIRLTLPSWATNLDYSGRADFTGEIGGIPSAMKINGELLIRDFIVESLIFDPTLQGKVSVIPEEGARLEIANQEQSDNIELVLAADFLPESFLLEHNDIYVEGKGTGENLKIRTRDIPVELLKTIAVKSPDFTIPEKAALQPVTGTLSGDFTTNLDTLATSGENITIINPILGKIKGDRLMGDFDYDDGYFALENVKFQQRDSTYQIEGNIIQQSDDLAFRGDVRIEQGQIQDVLIALEIFELADLTKAWSDRKYGTTKDLYQPPLPSAPEPPQPLFTVGTPNAKIFQQLQQLAEIQAQLNLAQQSRQEQFFVPELKTLTGKFDGQLTFDGSVAKGIKAEFDFEGGRWQWGQFTAEQIIANGYLQDGILTLLPVSIQSDNSLIAFSGSFGGETQSGQLRFVDVPVGLIEKFVQLPPDLVFGGNITASATIAGSQDNPQARGEIDVADATINQTSIQSTQGSFSYNNSRLNFFASSVVAPDAEPLTITGSIPYQFPFAKTEPDSDRLNLELNVKNEGLALLNILSRGEVNWIDGQGEVSLDISGKFDQAKNRPSKLIAKGQALVDGGKIAVRSFPDAYLTEVNGKINFDFDRIQVESFQGNFGGGKISAIGSLPLTKNLTQTNPLSINFNNLAIDLKGLYQGGVAGQLTILGTAVEPDLTGNLTLTNGSILIADTTTTANSVDIAEDNSIAALTEYKNLQIQLGENIQIIQPPISNFTATGKIRINGTFNSPLPEGTIALRRGQVNLFTTQLSLAGGYPNTARFSRNNGLDPYLDVRLVGSALETTRSPIPSDPLSTEINDIPASSFGTLETVRIYATVKGLASQLTNSIELTSSPPRSQTEILALLGGSFVDTLGRGDSTLGLANLAGSALFGSFNTVLSDAFGLSEFRLFPTQIIDEKRDGDRIIGLAAEAALDLTNNISFSVLKILNIDLPAQFGFRYRLNENFIIRGSSNFEDDTRGVIEYEFRF
jgi:translocation and assembly module TamB